MSWISLAGLRTPNGPAIDLSATITLWIVAMDDYVVVGLALRRSYPLNGAVDLVFIRSSCVRTHICEKSEISAPFL